MRSLSSYCFFCAIILTALLLQQVHGQGFKAVNDTIDLVPEIEKTVNLFENDTIPPGDSIVIYGGTGTGNGIVISTWHYGGYFTYLVPHRGVGYLFTTSYTLVDASTSESSTAQIVFRIYDKSFNTLNINDVEALFTAYGNHFTLPFGGTTTFIVPKGSGKSTLFSNVFWIGGLSENDSLYVAAERYRQGPTGGYAGEDPDFYAGPVMDSVNYSFIQDTTWNYVWKLTRAEIEFHKNHWEDPGYKPIQDILTWPGNGNMTLGQTKQLAPFHDRNSNGNYDPYDGDYPSVRGDQALYFIFNDDRGEHLETTGRKLKAEIHGMAYAYDIPGDSAFSKTVFMNYRIINRSSHTYHDVYMGFYTDFDIGFAADDFVQCDVGRGSIIGYNGKAIDGKNQPWAYGSHPPAQSVTFLAGLRMEPKGEDRPRYDNIGNPLCDESINGTGFGDGIPDNERLGLRTVSLPYSWIGIGLPEYMGPPLIAEQYYNYMKAIWLDTTQMIYGGKGHLGYGGYGPECTFIYPGESDTLSWGCGCKTPNGPINWTESTANNLPHDIAGIGLTGPIVFHPGDVQEIDIAFIWARDYTSTDTLASVSKLRNMIDIVRNSFSSNTLPGGGSFLGNNKHAGKTGLTVNIYPNPATSIVNIDFGIPLKEQTCLKIINSVGNIMGSFTYPNGLNKINIDVSDYPSGLYLLTFISEGRLVTKKLAVIR